MLTQQDIDTFTERFTPALEAANEYARRCQKGLPEDRWSDGVAGSAQVAQGIWAMQRLLSIQSDVIQMFMGLERERGEAAMEAARDPMRD